MIPFHRDWHCPSDRRNEQARRPCGWMDVTNLDCLSMASPAGADLPVIWLGVLASGVPHTGVGDPRDSLVCQLKTPEAACTETNSVEHRCSGCAHQLPCWSLHHSMTRSRLKAHISGQGVLQNLDVHDMISRHRVPGQASERAFLGYIL